MGASSVTSLSPAEQTLLELREIHRTVQRLELKVAALPSDVHRARAERAKARLEWILLVAYSVVMGTLAAVIGVGLGRLLGRLLPG